MGNIINSVFFQKRTKRTIMFNSPIIGVGNTNEIPIDIFIWPFVTLFGGNILLGILVRIFGKKDNSWIDAWWSISFLIPNLVIIFLRQLYMSSGMYFFPLYLSVTPRMWLITLCQAI